MNRFDEMFAQAAAPVLLEIMGDTVTYEDDNIAPVILTGIQSPVGITEEPVEMGEERRQRTTVTINRDPSSPYKGVANPLINARVTINGVRWTVDDIQPQSSSMVALHLIRISPVEVTREGMRME